MGLASLFRFHTGSIKSISGVITVAAGDGFDSILVRLKAPQADDVGLTLPTFRFHTGSIKSSHLFDVVSQFLRFRFHTGSIKSESS